MDGKKNDQGKGRWDLVPFAAMEEVVKVLTFGASKYGDTNWKKLDKLEQRYLAAAFRHLSQHMQGQELDDESGFPHLAHAVTGLLFVMQSKKENK